MNELYLILICIPQVGMNPVQIALAVREQQLRPPLPPTCPPRFGALLDACWHQEPEHRPPFAKVLETLADARAEFADDGNSSSSKS